MATHAKGCGKKRTHVHCHEEGKLVHPQFKSMCSLLGKVLEIYLVYELYHSRAYMQRTLFTYKDTFSSTEAPITKDNELNHSR